MARPGAILGLSWRVWLQTGLESGGKFAWVTCRGVGDLHVEVRLRHGDVEAV